MCRPDDFPPYDDGLLDPGEDWTPAPTLFRSLDPAEEKSFRAWAREHHDPGSPVNTLWHPVVRDECERMDREEAARQLHDHDHPMHTKDQGPLR
jgi:hypothetical protein